MSRGPDPKVSDIELLREFVISPEPAFISAEIAELTGTTEQTARTNLNKLVEKGYLERKKPGSRTVLYWITEEGRRYYAEESRSR